MTIEVGLRNDTRITYRLEKLVDVVWILGKYGKEVAYLRIEDELKDEDG